ncbi:MAG TPA: hypothetical protein VEB00_01740 [Clostridia bacterium]|nr:hypothetical protein [Clostridia bacterium]
MDRINDWCSKITSNYIVNFKEDHENAIFYVEVHSLHEQQEKLSNDIKDAFEIFGESMSVLPLESVYNLNINSIDDVEQGLSDFIENLECSGFTSCKVQVSISKKELVRKYITMDIKQSYSIKLFFRFENFLALVQNHDYSVLESSLFRKDIVTVVLVMDRVFLECFSSHLVIIGRQSVEYINSTLDRLSSPFSELSRKDCKNIITERHNHCSWINGPEYLTPNFFFFQDLSNAPDELGNILCRQFTNLTIPYLACNTKVDEDGSITCIFEGYRKIKIQLSREDRVFDLSAVEALYNLYEWIYSEKITDKIGIFRHVLTLYLKEDPKQNYGLFLDKIQEVNSSTQSNYQIYLKEKVDIWFEERRKVVDFFQTKVSEISGEITKITELMSKNLLTLIAVVIASMASYVTNGQKAVIQIAFLAFILFLIVGTIYFGVLSQISKGLLKKDIERFIEYTGTILLKDEISMIEGESITKREELFDGYFLVSILINIVIVFILIIALLNLDVWISYFAPAKQ